MERLKTVSAKTVAWITKRRWWLVGAAIVLAIVLVAPTIYANRSTASVRHTSAEVSQVPKHQVAIVFGAGVLPDGTPTSFLKSRVQAGVTLLRAGRVQLLLMSGDNRTSHYNEPVAMRKYAESLGVDPRKIVLDYAGYDTYDTCYRARYIFGLHDAVLVSQGYHLPRAIMTCDGLGVRSVGFATNDKAGQDYSPNYIAREYISTAKALVQIAIKPKPGVLGPPLPIE